MGFREDEISNKFEEWEKRVHPEDIEKSLSDLNSYINGETDSYENEHRMLCKKGSCKWILVKGKVISWTKDHRPLRIIGTHFDFSSQKQNEKELIAEKEFLEKIIETSAAIIVGLDKDHLIRIFNKGAEIISGYKKEELIGLDWYKIFLPERMLDEMKMVWKDAWGISSHSHENIIVTKTGEEKTISFQTTGFYEDNDINKHLLISIGEDVSHKKEAENKLLTINQLFSNLFENAPISLWNEDFTESMEYIEEQIKKYNLLIEELVERHPEVLVQCMEKVKILDVNNATIELYEAKSKKELLGNLSKVFTEDSLMTFKQSIIALYNKEEQFEAEGKTITLTGKELDVYLRWSFLRDSANSSIKVIVSVINVTELHQTEDELTTSESRFRAIFQNDHTVMFLIDPKNGKFIDANPAAIDYYGYKYEKIINELSIYDINTLSKKETLHKMEDAKRKKQAHFNFEHILSNGTYRKVEIYSGPIHFDNKKVLLSIVHDETERHEALEALEKSKNKLESIFRAAQTGIGVVSNRIITEVNQKFCEMMGYSANELLGKESIIIYPSKEEFEWVGKVKYDQIREKGTGTVDTKLLRKDGKIIDVLLSSTPIDMTNFSKGVTFTALDITERKNDLEELNKHRSHLEEIINERTSELKNSQDALLNLVDDLNRESEKSEKANQELEIMNRELETFTYSVSHDLKAPLRGIDGYSQLLLNSFPEELNPDARTFLGNIRKGTKQMNLLIEDLLAYSRMERKEFNNENLDFESLVNDLLLQFSDIIKDNKVSVKLSFPKELNLTADKDGMKLVLRNLLDNAFKFTASEKNAQIEIGSKENDTGWHIFVKDNGLGFDMKYQERIYNIFQRLNLPEEYEGTGIGLAMVKKAVERMNGKVWAESSLGKGACFYIEIYKTLYYGAKI